MSSFEVNGGVVDVYEPSSEDLVRGVRSKSSVKSSKSSRSDKRTICHCDESRESRSSAKAKKQRRSRSRCKKSARRDSERKKKLLAPLCICVRGTRSISPRSSCECPSKCRFLSKYDDCCCLKNKRKQRENNETGNNRRNSNDSGHRISREINSPNKCPCTPTPKPRRNIFVRGFSNLRKKMRKSNSSRCEYSVCNNPRECRKCPVKTCCAKNTSKERNRSTPVNIHKIDKQHYNNIHTVNLRIL
ncbi:uncharacterized protein LOC128894824 [Hylaeus anthracinus]|uniref:uncharacterized protein LOC128894824 n=1 Tax=Hylaeus anthracinus TaxID=313031 RepID=UPI0023B9EA23|nr:uncharacterized protein LOC128894824 [Hylaeus anthracinus]